MPYPIFHCWSLFHLNPSISVANNPPHSSKSQQQSNKDTMCRRPSHPRQPSNSQLLTGAAASGSVERDNAPPGTAGNTAPTTLTATAATATATAAIAPTAPLRNPIVDVLSRADAALLAQQQQQQQQQRRDFVAVSPPARTPSTSSQMTAEQRTEIRRMEWERLHPVVGVLCETDDDDDQDAAVNGAPDTASSSTSRRRPRRTVRGPQGKRLSVEAHPLKLLEDLQGGAGSTGDDRGDHSNGPSVAVRRAGRRRPRRRVRRADSVDSTIAAAHATKQ